LKEKIYNQWVDLSSRLISPKILNVEGIDLPVSSLREQLKAYEGLGREKDFIKIQKIKEILERQEE